MREIVDKLGTVYAVDAKLVAGMILYTVHASDVMVARAVLHPMRGAVTDVLVYREADRRRGIASALYNLIEQDLRQPLRPSRIRSKAGGAFWASRCPRARSSPLAQALVAGLLQGLGERDGDQNQVEAGKRLASQITDKGQTK